MPRSPNYQKIVLGLQTWGIPAPAARKIAENMLPERQEKLEDRQTFKELAAQKKRDFRQGIITQEEYETWYSENEVLIDPS